MFVKYVRLSVSLNNITLTNFDQRFVLSVRPFQFLSVFHIIGALQNLSVSQEKKKKS